ncbi:lasso peptide biosynthesis B2 protein [Sphingomonas sp.]|uniref:lasso peptide biosynthesis B2 protein n=1 Tax=Sphingomonas sp. TaxID=28214 RepID=UPI002E35276B|nr:lasso peptide biosynthesis B2 protein [Sphingomonas sp.]HEX4694083.1 lasso peptide biosynthesis B2 protein [Sphingomonas sp.]
MAAEAFASLAVARLTLLVVPFPVLAKRLSAPLVKRRSVSAAIPRRVGWAVAAAGRHSPIRFVCFPQALAARAMLHRRGVPTMLHYGVAKTEGKVHAHVWLSAAGTDVVGYVNKADFKLVATFPAQAICAE